MNRIAVGLGAALLAVAAAGYIAISGASEQDAAKRSPEERPRLALLTSLPLVFGEEFGLEGGGSPVLRRLQGRYDVVTIGIADAASLRDKSLLLMAHPRAQPAEVLVELDQWVRQGGRVLLLADPRLDRESGRPVGDPLRPPPGFADTGLLLHWGVTLSGPAPDGPADVGNGRIRVQAVSPGKLATKRCQVAGDGFVARCNLGRGRATIIADADFLDGEASGLDLLMDELERLEIDGAR